MFSLGVCRLKERKQFLRVKEKGRTVVKGTVVVQYAKSFPRAENTCGEQGVAIGFTATKKIGKAHVRNRAKRRLREAIRAHHPHIKSGYHIVFIARNATAHCLWNTLTKDVKGALQQAKLLQAKTLV